MYYDQRREPLSPEMQCRTQSDITALRVLTRSAGSSCKSGFTPLSACTSASEAVGDRGGDRSACTSTRSRKPSVQSLSRVTFSPYDEARLASRLPSAAATESRLDRSCAADALADGRSGDALPSRIRSCRYRRRRDVLRYRRAVFVQSAVDRPQRPATVQFGGVPSSTPRTAAAFARP